LTTSRRRSRPLADGSRWSTASAAVTRDGRPRFHFSLAQILASTPLSPHAQVCRNDHYGFAIWHLTCSDPIHRLRSVGKLDTYAL
jgi:hypothetical protein